MAGGYDASVRINTEMNTANISSQVMRVNESLRRLEGEAVRLRDRLHELGTTQIPTEEYTNISNQLGRAQNRLEQLIQRQQRMQAEGRNNGAAWERLNSQIEAARGEVGAVEAQMQELVQAGRAFRLGRDTDEYRRTAEQLTRVETDIEINSRRLQEMNDRQHAAADGFDEMADAAADGFREIGNFAERSLRSIDSVVKRLKQSIGSLFGSSKKMNAAVRELRQSVGSLLGSLGFGLSIAGIVMVGKEAMELASDIQEVQNVVDTAFGSMSYKMEKFADTAITQFGISKLSAKQLGSTFMAMGKTMVGNMETASDMAINLTARAADMSSFYNKSIEETSTALKSIYTGETESLKEYGVVMTQVNLEEFARQRGIHKSIQAMGQAEKVQLQYAYVMEQTSLAAGDFAKTSDSWANQTRILKEQFKELLSVMGTGLITVFMPIVKFLNTILTQLIAIAQQIGAVLTKLLGISVPTLDSGKIAQELEGAAGGADDLAEGVEAAGKAAKKALASFDDLNVLSQNNGSGASGGTGNSFQMPELEMDEAEIKTEELGESAGKLMDILAHLFNPFKEAWDREGQFVMDSWHYALVQIGELLKQIGKDFLRMWDSAETVNILADILHIIGDIGLIVGHLAENFREAWIQNDVGYKIFCNLRDIIGAIVHNIRLAADYTVEWASSLDFYPLLSKLEEWTGSLIPVYDALSGIVTDFYTMVLLPLGKWTLEKGLPELLQVFVDFNSKVDWEGLRANMQQFWEHLEPFAETVGEGLIIFIRRVSDALADFLNSDVFVSLLHAVENWMDSVSPEDVADGMERLVKALIAFKAAMLGLGLIKGIVSIIEMFRKLMPVIDQIGKVLMKLVTFGRNVVGVFELMSNAGMTLGEAISTIFGSAAATASGIVSIVGGVILAITNFVGMLTEGFSWIKEIAMVAGTALAAIGAIILGAPALVAGIVAAVVAAVGTIVVVIHDNWEAICKWFSGVAEWIHENVIQPVIEFFKGVWDSVSGFFSGLWNDIVGIWSAAADWFSSNVIEPVVNFFQGLWTRVKQIFEGLWIIIQAVWKVASEWFNAKVITPIVGFFQGVWESVSAFFTSLWEDIVAVWELAAGWFKEKVVMPVTDFFQGVWKNVSEFFSNLWEDIQTVWGVVSGWFDENIITPVQEAFETACDAIGGFFENLWTGIKRGIAGAMNAVIGSVEGALNWLVDGINGIISGFNRVVSWAANIIEVDWGGVDLLPNVSLGRIPALADGAVIRGGNPFMAILGDQPKGQTNIETPLPTMVKAFKQAMAESGGMCGEITIKNQIVLDRKVVSETVNSYNQEQFERTGRLPFEF